MQQKYVRIDELNTERGYGPCFVCGQEGERPKTALRMTVGSRVAADNLAEIYRHAGLTVEKEYHFHQPTRVGVLVYGCPEHQTCLGRLKETIEMRSSAFDLERILAGFNLLKTKS